MTSQIICLSGPSGSGKTTLLRDKFGDPETLKVSRDLLRNMLFNYTDETVRNYYLREDLNKLESIVSEVQTNLISLAIANKKTIVIDNTHLRIKYIKNYKRFMVPIILYVLRTPINICIARDRTRSHNVGERIIQKQFKTFAQLHTNLKNEGFVQGASTMLDVDMYVWNPDEIVRENLASQMKKRLPNCYIVDIDGTIAERGNRSPYDWAKVGRDIPKTSIIRTVVALKRAGFKIVICTGRDGICEEETKDWLKRYGIPYDRFYMRQKNDGRKDYIVKEEMWRKIIKKYYVVGMLDDRLQVINHARRLGFTVLDVAGHTF